MNVILVEEFVVVVIVGIGYEYLVVLGGILEFIVFVKFGIIKENCQVCIFIGLYLDRLFLLDEKCFIVVYLLGYEQNVVK